MKAYRDLFRVRYARPLLATSLIGRYPQGMVTLSVTLAVLHAGGSVAAAGAVSAAYVGGCAVTGPLLGRALDRRDRRSILLVFGSVNALCFLLFAWLVTGPAPVAVGAALLTGATQPPMVSALRSAWSALLTTHMMPVALSLEASLQELIFISGPVLVVAVSAWAEPQVTLILCGAFALCGSVGFGLIRLTFVSSTVVARSGLITRSWFVRVLFAAAAVDASMTSASLAIVARLHAASGSGAPAPGIALAVWAAGSFVGGVVSGLAPRLMRKRLWIFPAAALLQFPALVAVSTSWWLLAVLVLGGSTIAPIFSRLYSTVITGIPRTQSGEAFGWLTTAFLLGGGFGSVCAGWLISESGYRAGLMLAGALMAAATIIAVPSFGDADARWRPGLRRHHPRGARC